MKRLLSILLCLLLLTGCTPPHPPADTAPPRTTAPAETTPTTVPPPTISAEVLALRENLPAMDGSTSLIPLEAGIRAAIFDISMEEATQQVAHTSTWSSFYNLLDGSAQLIFSCPLSQEQWQIAAERDIALEAVPVAMEGFVFVVNGDNPVDTLTQQQLKDIYSGKITNWNEVGGMDLPIIPYQRNADSGSQNYMADFMGDVPLMDAPVEMRPATMEGLMDVVAINDNALGAIGYSVYAYAADMYGSGDEIKFIRVDGVAPDKNTMAAGEYPLLGKNYAIFRADEPEDSPARALVGWMTSYDGQLAIAKAGYVTVQDIGFDYQQEQLAFWQGTGTGPAADEPAVSEWTATGISHSQWGDSYLEILPVVFADGVCRVPGISDGKLADEINAFVADQMTWVPQARAELEQWVALQNRGNEFGLCSVNPPWPLSEFMPQDSPCSCIVTARNGFLSVAVSVCGTSSKIGSEYMPWRTETATWDLLTGKRLQPEDLFCRDVDADAVLNEAVRSYSLSPTDSWGVYPDMKQDFISLPMTGWHLTHDAVYIDHANPYFATGVRIPLDDLPDGLLAAEAERAFDGTLEHEDILCFRRWRISDRDSRYAYNADGLVSCGFLMEEVHPNAAKINAEVMDYLNTYFTENAIAEYYANFDVSIEDVEIWMLDWDLQNLGGRYLLFQGGAPYHMVDHVEDQIVYPYVPCLLYDLESGRRIPWTALFREGWRDAVTTVVRYPDMLEAALPGGELELRSIHLQDNGSLDVTLRQNDTEYHFSIPWDYVNFG